MTILMIITFLFKKQLAKCSGVAVRLYKKKKKQLAKCSVAVRLL